MTLQTKGTLDGLTRKISKGLEVVTFKLTIPTPKNWDKLKDFADQEVSISITVRQGALKLESPEA